MPTAAPTTSAAPFAAPVYSTGPAGPAASAPGTGPSASAPPLPAGPRVDPFDALLRAALDPRSWRALCPGLHVEGERLAPDDAPPRVAADDAVVSTRPLREGELREALGDLRAEGYLELPELLRPEDAARLEGAAARLHQRGLPPVFSFVYDEPWRAAALLSPVLSAALGPGYRQLPDFWAWLVPPSEEARGWVPHRDRPGTPRQDGLPATLTLWVALSEATPRNGCMYILPRGRDARFGTSEIPEVGRGELQDLRALPASPGTVFIWDQDVYHWGSRSSARARRPRVSFACEFQRGDFPPYNAPLRDPLRPPDFQGRLRLIGKQLRQYQHMHALSPLLARLAERLVLL